jgi:hypothetical protein
MKLIQKLSLLCIAAFSIGSGPSYGFTPDLFEVTFYEIGLTNSSNRALRFKIFSGNATVDLMSTNTSILSSGVVPTPGTWNEIYVITSNTIRVAGNDGTCYVRTGNASSSENDFTGVSTNNSALAGPANLTWTDFSGSSGPENPSVSTSLNGTRATSVVIYTTNSGDPAAPTVNNANRFLFAGSGGISVTTNEGSKGFVQMNFGLSNSMYFANSCGNLSYSNSTYGLSVGEE